MSWGQLADVRSRELPRTPRLAWFCRIVVQAVRSTSSATANPERSPKTVSVCVDGNATGLTLGSGKLLLFVYQGRGKHAS
jgi:hypothetical protein